MSRVPDPMPVTDITYIRIYEGLLYLDVVLDFYSRAAVGSTPARHLSGG